MAIFTVFLINAMIVAISCMPDGPPMAACGDLTPQHNPSTGTEDPPTYAVTISPGLYGPGAAINVTFAKNGPTKFKGLIVQARKKSGGTTPVGTFSTPSTGTKTIQCTAADDTWGHADAADKAEVTATWTAPMSNEGDLVLSASVVIQNSGGVSIFYTGLMSDDLVYSGPTEAPDTAGSVRASLIFMVLALFTVAIIGRFL